jgi:hypothetical protein
MTLRIDDAFIRSWHPKYDQIQTDEAEYNNLVKIVQREIRVTGTISRDTFLAIWKWKGAMRVIRRIRLDQYQSRYAEAFCRAAAAPQERKLGELLRSTVKLPGVGAPTGSTIIHFIHPETMPIIDVRTVEALHAPGRVSTKQRDLGHYEEFRRAIDQIRCDCPNWTLREIDRALFAYHKLVMDKGGRHNCRT